MTGDLNSLRLKILEKLQGQPPETGRQIAAIAAGLQLPDRAVLNWLAFHHGSAAGVRAEIIAEQVIQLAIDIEDAEQAGQLHAAQILRDYLAELREEYHRQIRIAAGHEHACANCGCSESRPCPGGCCWATDRLCSRCA